VSFLFFSSSGAVVDIPDRKALNPPLEVDPSVKSSSLFLSKTDEKSSSEETSTMGKSA